MYTISNRFSFQLIFYSTVARRIMKLMNMNVASLNTTGKRIMRRSQCRCPANFNLKSSICGRTINNNNIETTKERKKKTRVTDDNGQVATHWTDCTKKNNGLS